MSVPSAFNVILSQTAFTQRVSDVQQTLNTYSRADTALIETFSNLSLHQASKTCHESGCHCSCAVLTQFTRTEWAQRRLPFSLPWDSQQPDHCQAWFSFSLNINHPIGTVLPSWHCRALCPRATLSPGSAISQQPALHKSHLTSPIPALPSGSAPPTRYQRAARRGCDWPSNDHQHFSNSGNRFQIAANCC